MLNERHCHIKSFLTALLSLTGFLYELQKTQPEHVLDQFFFGETYIW